MVKKLVNDPHDVVAESMEGLALLQPGLRLLEGRTTAVRADRLSRGVDDPDLPVAVVTGGGAGHEPADAGYVARGMLTAAVSGPIFSSPGPDSVAEAIRAVTGRAGCLLLVKNYTGDRLNFRLGAELARAEGYRVELLTVADDVSLAPSGEHAGRRGLAGSVVVAKVAGALAEQGADLGTVRETAAEVAASLGTMNLGLGPLTVPGAPEPAFELGDDEAELGLGVHGEPGVQRIRVQPADKLIHYLVARIATDRGIRAGARVVALVGSAGATPPMERQIAARAVVRDLTLRRIDIVRLYAGPVLTSLDMAGVSVTLLPATDRVVELLDAPTDALAWPGRGVTVPPRLVTVPHAVAAPDDDPAGTPDPVARAAIDAACQALLDAETELTRLDQRVGDGDLGSALARGAYGWFDDPVDGDAAHQLRRLSWVFRREVGGTSGALYSMGLLRAADALASGAGWDAALVAAVEGVSELGAAQQGDGTMLDALVPAAQAASAGAAQAASGTPGEVGALAAVVEAAREGAASTVAGIARRGRASYLGARGQGHPDPGAVAVVRWLEAVASSVSGQRFPSGPRG